jgi:hypothetical protein
MNEKTTITDAMRRLRAAGYVMTKAPLALKKKDVTRINAALNQNDGRVVIMHTRHRLIVYSMAQHERMLDRASHARKHKSAPTKEFPGVTTEALVGTAAA